ncbi:hypothetical protein [Saccharopolyspora shandongensis]|uniref:hypothetical protein n=1 Tax=Saccharopolyspora shandongensis TaxID=418495 RepID=UPI0033E67C88
MDMEGYGFLHGAYVNDSVYALVIRGISDLLTNKTESADRQWQSAAARHAAAFAVELLTTLTPRTPPTGSGHTRERVASITATHTGAVRQSGSGHHITNTGIVLGDINAGRAVR